MKHTQGNWGYSLTTPYGDSACFHIQSDIKTKDTFIGEVGGGLQDNEQIEANARLLAAAPIMLESLKYVKAVFETILKITLADRQAYDALQLIYNTINKATK